MIDVVTSPRPRAPHPKAASGRLDCVVVGYLDIDFQRYFDKQKEMSAHSGAYRDALHNSVRWQDRRLTYMNLLNESIEAGTGRRSQLSAFEVPNLAYRDGAGGLVRTARSCPFECSFCNFPAMAGEHLVAGLEALERQFDLLHERGVSSLIFIDDTFNVPLPRFKSLLRRMIDRRYDFSWMSFFRCSNADEASFDLMAESGCKQVFLGIESGDQDILTNMNKHAKLDKYREGIAKLKARGITTYASIILGFPGETEQTVRNTLAFLEETQPDFYNVQLYYHDLRTPIHQSADRFKIQGAGYSWRHETMDWKQAADWVDHAFANVRGSIPMTLYGFSVWAMPYLISRGIDTERIKAFGATARELLVASFADRELDAAPYRERLADVFRPAAA